MRMFWATLWFRLLLCFCLHRRTSNWRKSIWSRNISCRIFLNLKVFFKDNSFLLTLCLSPCLTLILQELNISTHNQLPCFWIIQFITFSYITIINENTLLTFIIKLFYVLLWYMGICNTPKNSQKRNFWFMTTPNFLRRSQKTTLVGHLFNKNSAHVTASAQNFFGRDLAFNMFFAISIMVLFFLSTIPFFLGI